VLGLGAASFSFSIVREGRASLTRVSSRMIGQLGLELTPTHAELGAAGEAVVLGMESLAAHDERQLLNVRRGGLEGSIAMGMAQTMIDR
jgi:hypothetical protein